ncbi:hypothetical protein EZS27_001550 [termite gut metagenome]|uniref:Uncharacterized protein n=1 Tax=termite gut metagenome TaxID=433724 RepID=A0A5J4SYN9_9ZZZZ
MTKRNENLSRDSHINPTLILPDPHTSTADAPSALTNQSFDIEDNPFSQTIYSLLRLFRKQSKSHQKEKQS